MVSPLLAALLSASLGLVSQGAGGAPAAQAQKAQQAPAAPGAVQVAGAPSADATTLPSAPPGMVTIPAGRTVMGTEPSQVQALSEGDPSQMLQVLAETPRHTMVVDTFFIDRTEVTNLQWKVFLDATARQPSAALSRYGWPAGAIAPGEEQLPVTNVNALEISDYLRWCGKRLPTEAEWTRAARGDDQRLWPWGSDWDNRKCLSGLSVSVKPRIVGNYPAGSSPYGVLDMAGNVSEWVDSPFTAFAGFQPGSFGKGKGSTRLSPEFGADMLVAKGGGFLSVKRMTRIDTRFGCAPERSDAALGFRAARSARAGLDALRNAVRFLRPAKLSKPGQLDEQDVFAREATVFDEARHIVTGYRCLAFAHTAEPAPPLTRVRRDARDVPLVLGVLVSSEPLVTEPVIHDGPPVTLPAAEYTLAFKPAGESKAHRDQRLAASAAASHPAAKPAAVADATHAAPRTDLAAPPASIHDVLDDIAFDQDADAILVLNTRKTVVGWIKALDPSETDPAPLAATSSDGGKVWRIAFTLRQAGGKRADRFALDLKLGGAGLE